MSSPEFHVPAPWMARVCARAGPARVRLLRKGALGLMAVPGRYCVSYLLLSGPSVAIFDLGSAADLPRIRGALRWLGRSPSDVVWIAPSHLHFDHCMGVDAVAQALQRPVRLGELAHAHVKRALPLRFPPGLRSWRALLTWPMQGLPVFPRSDWQGGMDFGFPWARNRFRARLDEPLVHDAPAPELPGWRVFATPGHADDSIALHCPDAGWLVSGDTARNFYGGEWNPLITDEEAMERSIELLEGLDVVAVGPGHGPMIEGPDVSRRLRRVPFFLP